MYESQVLHPGDPFKNTEDWPMLKLTDVSVVRYRRGFADELVDLYDVFESGPFRVKGILEPVSKKHRKIVRAPEAVGHPIVISGVNTYSMEYMLQRPSGRRQARIWFLGAAGWYEISPSAEYRMIYKELVEKTSLWMFLRERYAKFHGQASRLIKGTMADICKDFVNYESSCRTTRVASRLFDKHHRFLLLEMLSPESDYNMWKKTPVYKYYKENFKEATEEILQIFNPAKQARFYHKHTGKKPHTTPPIVATPKLAESTRAFDGDDRIEDEHTPDQIDFTDSEGEETGKKISSKGHSSLRPSCIKLAVEPLCPINRPLLLNEKSQIETRLTLKRRSEANVTPCSKRLQLPLPSSPPPPTLPSSPPPPTSAPSEVVADQLGLPRGDRTCDASPAPVHPASPQLTTVPHTSYRWRCTLDISRCNHVVANVRTREGKSEVERHYASHGKLMDEALQTIDLEMQRYGGARGGYNVDNLMGKIQKMSRKWQEGKPTPLKCLEEQRANPQNE